MAQKPRRFLRSPWVQQGSQEGWAQSRQGWGDTQPLTDEEKAHWIGMDESTFFSLSVRLSQSQRDKLIHARRLKAAGQGIPFGVE
eukprot:1522570-Pyramimonas_sp.AAC.1